MTLAARWTAWAAACLTVLTAVASCADAGTEPADRPYDWNLPAGVRPPPDPPDNPTTEAKVELGRRLFFDRRLSSDGTYACASCHAPSLAFSDGRARAVGIYGEELPRGAPGLAGVGYLVTYTWVNPHLVRLEAQALVPMVVKRPAELDIADRFPEVADRLMADADIAQLLAIAFGESTDITIARVAQSLAAYERTLVAADSPYDRFLAGDASALSPAAGRGRELFFSERLGCGSCHSGRWLSDATSDEESTAVREPFHNTGLYNLGGTGAYPGESPGLIEFTGREEDRGRFRTPPLRNVAITAPYMHDGTLATLDEVLDHYAMGGRTIASGPHAGAGADNPYKDERVNGFELTADERADLLAFFDSLTDESFVTAEEPAQ